MPNHNQRTAIIAIANGQRVRKATFEALQRKGLADRGLFGKQILTKQGVAWISEVIPNFSLTPGT